MRVSPNFTREELERNSRGLPNELSVETLMSYKIVCEFLLEPIRARFGPLRITSGYRSPALNEAVGGSPLSQHKATGDYAACDFQPVVKTPLETVFDWIRLESGLPFDQVILERGREERHEYDDCIHISWRRQPRRMAMAGEVQNRGPYTRAEVK
ncbi:MAG: D-Ala-D-Ala carboxypeptidase family metallohydrolase [Acidobacteriales bacterium]|nr:D-Ala-D-Ala carboxypeptidase family metallohydrolase [Terriglobales bacterium]